MGGTAIASMLKDAFKDWRDDNAPRLGAALSYYTTFSIAPLLMITIAIAGLAFGADAARGRIVAEVQGLLGKTGAEAVEAMLRNAHKPGTGIFATVVGVVTLLLGASGAFTEPKSALNTVWEVETPKGGGIRRMVRERLGSFAMVLVVGFLLLVSLVVSAALSALGTVFGRGIGTTLHLLQAANLVVSLAVVTALFALIFKLLPDTRVAWKDVWVGALMTSGLFTLGKFLIGLYLGSRNVGSAYGAAGSLVIVLVWVYYAAQILFFGAELTQVWARRHGSRIGAATKKDLASVSG